MAKKARVWTSSTSSVEAYVVHFNSYEELETELTRLRTSCSMGPCPILLHKSRTFLSKRSLPTRDEIDVDMFGIPEAGEPSQAVKRSMEELESRMAVKMARGFKRMREEWSYRTAAQIGAELLHSLTDETRGLGGFEKSLRGLRWAVIDALLDDPLAKAAFQELENEKDQLPAGEKHKMKEEHVQRFYGAVFSALERVAPQQRLHVLDTSACGLGHKKPTFTISSAEEKAVWYAIWFLEVKSWLANSSKHQEAVSQCQERSEMAFDSQPERNHCITVAAGADSLEIWRFSRDLSDGPYCSTPQLLSWDRASAALQLLVRLWTTQRSALGFVDTALPHISKGDVLLDEPNVVASLSQTADSFGRTIRTEAQRTIVIQGKWNGETVVAKSSRDVAAEKAALVYLAKHGVNNVVSLVDDTLVDGQMWLILQPLGERLPDGPAELVVANTNALAAIIEELAAVKMLHGDIAYSNIGYLPETKKPFFLDFGCAQMLDQEMRTSRMVTGTPQFMSLAAIWHKVQNVSTELESLMYVLLYIATAGRLIWRTYGMHRVEAGHVKFACMTARFRDDVLVCIPDPALKEVATAMQRLFFPGFHHRSDVTVKELQSALAAGMAAARGS